MDRNEAIKEVRSFIGQLTEGCQEAIRALVPELAESEDERIMKELIAYLAHRADVTEFIDEGEDCKRWISYLVALKYEVNFKKLM